MILLSLTLLVPWASGAVLVVLDGRRRVVGWLATLALAANFGMLIALADVVLSSGPIR
jgi:multicomponent Na+:H+ antiporter subunit D